MRTHIGCGGQVARDVVVDQYNCTKCGKLLNRFEILVQADSVVMPLEQTLDIGRVRVWERLVDVPADWWMKEPIRSRWARWSRWLNGKAWRWRVLVHFPLSVVIEVVSQVGLELPPGIAAPWTYAVHEITQRWIPETRHSIGWHFLDWLPSVPASVLVWGARIALRMVLA